MNDRPSQQHEDNFPDKELADLWNRQETTMASTANSAQLAQLAASTRAGHRSAQNALIWLNMREVGVALMLCVYFAYLGIVEAAVLYASSLLMLGIAVVLIGSTIRQNKVEEQFDDTTLRGSIGKALSQARHRLTMYRSAGWWYVAPLAAAFGIFCASAIAEDPNGAKPSDAVVIAIAVALLAVLVWWTRRIALTKWQPEVDRLEALMADLDNVPGRHT